MSELDDETTTVATSNQAAEVDDDEPTVANDPTVDDTATTLGLASSRSEDETADTTLPMGKAKKNVDDYFVETTERIRASSVDIKNILPFKEQQPKTGEEAAPTSAEDSPVQSPESDPKQSPSQREHVLPFGEKRSSQAEPGRSEDPDSAPSAPGSGPVSDDDIEWRPNAPVDPEDLPSALITLDSDEQVAVTSEPERRSPIGIIVVVVIVLAAIAVAAWYAAR